MVQAIPLAPADVRVTAAEKTVRPLLFVGLPLAVLWFVCCRHLSQEWHFNEQYSYGWFVPFFALYLFWLRWVEGRPARRMKDEGGRMKFLALTLIAGCAIILLPLRVFEVASSDYRPLGWLHALAAVTITLGVLFLIGGWAWLRHFSFPVFFFLTAVPWVTAIEAPIIEGLMRGIAALAAETLALFGVPAQAEANLLRLPSGVVGVNEACSGVRSLQTSIMIGLLFGELKRLRALRRVWQWGRASPFRHFTFVNAPRRRPQSSRARLLLSARRPHPPDRERLERERRPLFKLGPKGSAASR